MMEAGRPEIDTENYFTIVKGVFMTSFFLCWRVGEFEGLRVGELGGEK